MSTSLKFTIAFIFFAFTEVFAQDNLPPVYEIKTDTASVFKLNDNYSQMLEDPEDRYTIRQVISLAFSSHFHHNNTSQTGVNRKVHTYWFRFRIHNQLDRDVQLYFDNYAKSMELFALDSNAGWQRQFTGDIVPWSQRDGLRLAKKLGYTIRKGQQAFIYQRLRIFRNRITEIPSPSFQTRERFLTNFYADMTEGSSLNTLLAMCMALGILLVAALFNLTIFVLIRDRVYLYFCLWILTNPLYYYVNKIEVPFFEQFCPLIFAFNPYINSLAFISILQFIRSFLVTRQRAPVWDKALLFMGSLFIMTILLSAVFTNELIFFLNKISALYTLSISGVYILSGIISIQLIRQGYSPARFLLIAIFPRVLLRGIVDSVTALTLLITNESYIITNISLSQRLQEIASLWMVVVFMGILIQRYNQARKDLALQTLEKERLEKEKEIERSKLIEEQKILLENQVTVRTMELKQSLEHLKATQAQLIQSEKMASLGELTAGIAHEIQNPLNFINNFSEVNKELLLEMKDEIDKGNINEVKSIANDLINNQEKINHHDKRADAIVKGMMQHSKTNTGQKELIDINALCDEYLRLSYHGLRAKDKNFNADFKTHFDNLIGKINIIPQDIGRVLLNLYNNAFYAVDEKKKSSDESYKPLVLVSTKTINDKVEIKVSDNGNGIPQNIVDKIFQPFFTTKPTGQGTGLGWSLSYDIIKAHGGEIKVETAEGEETKFKIYLLI